MHRPMLRTSLLLAGLSVPMPLVLHVSFTPDQKWVVFRSNMLGRSYVFAVEVAKAAEKVEE